MSLPFVGSEIGLVSNSDIRFQGTLHSINPNDSTVALEQAIVLALQDSTAELSQESHLTPLVKSFGTEGRKGNPAEEIPASDQIFPYIVFKGTDIKDLFVISGPKVPEVSQPHWGANSYGMNPYYAQQQAMAFQQQQPWGQAYSQPMQPMGYNSSVMMDPMMMQPPVNPSAFMTPPPPLVGNNQGFAQPPPVPDTVEKQGTTVPKQVPAPASVKPAKTTQNVEKVQETPKTFSLVANGSTSAQQQQGKKIEVTLNLLKETKGTSQQGKQDYKKQHAVSFELPPKPSGGNTGSTGNNGERESGRQQGNRRQPGQGRQGQPGHPSRSSVKVPDTEFDFERSNAKFDKTEIVTAEVQVESTGAYQKTSFFDNISCEIKDRAQGKKFDRKSHHAEEKNQNLETFGTTGIHRGNRRGRGRGRGGRGRGRSYSNGNRNMENKSVAAQS